MAVTERPRGWDWRHPANRAIRSELVDAIRSNAAPELEGSGQILEIGCGSGWLFRALAQEVSANRLNGIDIDAGRTEAAARALPGAKFVTGDARDLPYA